MNQTNTIVIQDFNFPNQNETLDSKNHKTLSVFLLPTWLNEKKWNKIFLYTTEKQINPTRMQVNKIKKSRNTRKRKLTSNAFFDFWINSRFSNNLISLSFFLYSLIALKIGFGTSRIFKWTQWVSTVTISLLHYCPS